MAYRNTKPDSPKGQIYTKYASDGQKAALAHGQTLGVDEKRVQRWFKHWGDVTPVVKTATAPATTKVKPPVKGGIKVKWSVRPVKLIARGEQQCEVKWLDTGSYQGISTNEIDFAKPD